MSQRRIGLWLIGAFGGVASTAVLGLAALRRGLTESTSLVTALPLFSKLQLDDAAAFVIGGHDIRQTTYRDSVQELHRKANVFSADVIRQCEPELAEWTKNVRPGTLVNSGTAITRQANWPGLPHEETASQALTRVKADLEAFRQAHKLDQLIMVNVSSTEPYTEPSEAHASMANLRAALQANATTLPASLIYAWAAIETGAAFVNFTPSLGASCPALLDLARERKTVVAGQDGKTGETLMKSVLAPMFAHRNLKILSWVGHNIFGNRDGQVLDDPVNKASKIKTKDQLIGQIVGYKPQTLVTIEYIESMDDWKTAWNHIHFEGFLGTKMVLQFLWQGCDSLLAAPLMIDLVRLTAHAQRQGEVGILRHLACFFKNPMGVEDHHFFRQWAMLEDYVARQ